MSERPSFKDREATVEVATSDTPVVVPEPKLPDVVDVIEVKDETVLFVDGEKHEHKQPKVAVVDLDKLEAEASAVLAAAKAALSEDDDDTTEDDLDVLVEVITILAEGGKVPSATIAALKAKHARRGRRKARQADRVKSNNGKSGKA